MLIMENHSLQNLLNLSQLNLGLAYWQQSTPAVETYNYIWHWIEIVKIFTINNDSRIISKMGYNELFIIGEK